MVKTIHDNLVSLAIAGPMGSECGERAQTVRAASISSMSSKYQVSATFDLCPLTVAIQEAEEMVQYEKHTSAKFGLFELDLGS
jgi:hypothetical protein